MSRVAVDAREAAPPWHYPSALVDRLTLADGRVVVMRPVQAFDALAEQDFIRALSPASRLKRFHFGLKELPSALLRAMTEVDHRQHVAVIAERLDSDDDGVTMVVADARYVIDADPHEAEFALAVAEAWQGVGLGRALMCRLARHAARRGVTRLVGDVLPDNRAMFAIVDALGGSFEASPNGPGVTRVRLPARA